MRLNIKEILSTSLGRSLLVRLASPKAWPCHLCGAILRSAVDGEKHVGSDECDVRVVTGVMER